MAGIIAPTQMSHVGGQAAPAGEPSKQQPGIAAPGGNAKPAGSTSTPSLEDAVVAEKKKAEHWQRKAKDGEQRNAALEERLAKLEGLAQGLGQNGQPASRRVETFADLDDTAFDDIVKRGMEENNPGYLASSMREIARRAAETAATRAVAETKEHVGQLNSAQQVASRITQEFGATAWAEESDLRNQADRYMAPLLRNDPKVFQKNPDALYLCFAAAERDLRAGDKLDLDRLRTDEATRQARAEDLRSKQTVATKAKADVAELLGKKDIKGAIRERLPWTRTKE